MCEYCDWFKHPETKPLIIHDETADYLIVECPIERKPLVVFKRHKEDIKYMDMIEAIARVGTLFGPTCKIRTTDNIHACFYVEDAQNV